MCSAFPKEIAGRHSPLEAGFLIPPSDLAIRIEIRRRKPVILDSRPNESQM
jgi:hypothetical protein